MIFDVWRRDLAGQVTVAKLLESIQVLEKEVAQTMQHQREVRNLASQPASLCSNGGPAGSRRKVQRRRTTTKNQWPTWFSGEILSPGVYMVDLMYAGDHHVVIMVAQCISVAHEPLLLLLRPCLPRRVVGIVAHEPLCLGCFCPGCGLVASWMVFCVMLWGLVCGWCFLASWLR